VQLVLLVTAVLSQNRHCPRIECHRIELSLHIPSYLSACKEASLQVNQGPCGRLSPVKLDEDAHLQDSTVYNSITTASDLTNMANGFHDTARPAH
jgi:hypothetical protein